MNQELLRERRAFKQKALATPNIQKKPIAVTATAHVKDAAIKKKHRPNAPKLDASNYKTWGGSSQYRFGVLAKIVNHLRTRLQQGENFPLSLDEILDETKQLDIAESIKNWLLTEALINNPKIEVTPEGPAFSYKPVYNIKNGKALMRLLKNNDLKGLGGILLDEVEESLPNCDKVLKKYESEILYVKRPTDKKKILFYNDRSSMLAVDEEFKNLWRSTTVDAMDDATIDKYLEKQGLNAMKNEGPKKPIGKRRKVKKMGMPKKPRDNEHVADILETYADDKQNDAKS